jgi:hypothetical protein
MWLLHPSVVVCARLAARGRDRLASRSEGRNRRKAGTKPWLSVWLNVGMTTDAARALVDELDLGGVFVCPACLFDLAWKMHTGMRLHPQTVTATAGWTWDEVEPGLREAVVEARMREVPCAEDALRDLDQRGPRGALARIVVERLARDIADEIAGREL